MKNSNKKTHVVYIPESFPLISETFIINEIKGIIEEGYCVSICPRLASGVTVSHSNYQKIKPLLRIINKHETFCFSAFIYALIRGNQKFSSIYKNIRGHIQKSIQIAKHVQSIILSRPDIIIIHFGFDNAIAGVIASKITGCPVITWFHGSDIYTSPHRSIRWITNKSGKIITNSQYSSRQLRKLGVKDDIEISHLGVNISTFQPTRNIKKCNEPVLICVARLGHNKNHQTLLSIFEKLLKLSPHAKLWLIGDGPFKSKYTTYVREKGIENNVVFWGSQSQEKIIELMNMAWIKVLLSDKEALGVAFIEAQAVGLPCIGTKVGGIPEVISDNKTGFVFSPEDKEFDAKVLSSILTLIENETERFTMGIHARKRVIENFDEKLHIKKMKKIINSLLEND